MTRWGQRERSAEWHLLPAHVAHKTWSAGLPAPRGRAWAGPGGRESRHFWPSLQTFPRHQDQFLKLTTGWPLLLNDCPCAEGRGERQGYPPAAPAVCLVCGKQTPAACAVRHTAMEGQRAQPDLLARSWGQQSLTAPFRWLNPEKTSGQNHPPSSGKHRVAMVPYSSL